MMRPLTPQKAAGTAGVNDKALGRLQRGRPFISCCLWWWWVVATAQATIQTSSRPRCICYYSCLGKFTRAAGLRSSPRTGGTCTVALQETLRIGSHPDPCPHARQVYSTLFSSPGCSGYQSSYNTFNVRCRGIRKDHDALGREKRACEAQSFRVVEDLLPGATRHSGRIMPYTKL